MLSKINGFILTVTPTVYFLKLWLLFYTVSELKTKKGYQFFTGNLVTLSILIHMFIFFLDVWCAMHYGRSQKEKNKYIPVVKKSFYSFIFFFIVKLINRDTISDVYDLNTIKYILYLIVLGSYCRTVKYPTSPS